MRYKRKINADVQHFESVGHLVFCLNYDSRDLYDERHDLIGIIKMAIKLIKTPAGVKY